MSPHCSAVLVSWPLAHELDQPGGSWVAVAPCTKKQPSGTPE